MTVETLPVERGRPRHERPRGVGSEDTTPEFVVYDYQISFIVHIPSLSIHQTRNKNMARKTGPLLISYLVLFLRLENDRNIAKDIDPTTRAEHCSDDLIPDVSDSPISLPACRLTHPHVKRSYSERNSGCGLVGEVEWGKEGEGGLRAFCLPCVDSWKPSVPPGVSCGDARRPRSLELLKKVII